MLAFLTSPQIALVVLAVLVLETVILVWFWQSKRRGLPPRQTLFFLGAGAGFALALYSALAGAGAIWLSSCLTVAFLCHVADLASRWR
ncbi:MAG: hypothetical protein AAF903_00240 [Pseudomonadota bacterium]